MIFLQTLSFDLFEIISLRYDLKVLSKDKLKGISF